MNSIQFLFLKKYYILNLKCNPNNLVHSFLILQNIFKKQIDLVLFDYMKPKVLREKNI